MACDSYLQNWIHSNISRQGYQDIHAIERSAFTTDTHLEKAGLTMEQ